MVEARFVCNFVGPVEKNTFPGEEAEGRQVNFTADVEDPVFKVFTPAGNIGMKVVGQAADQFVPGIVYRVTFEAMEVGAVPKTTPDEQTGAQNCGQEPGASDGAAQGAEDSKSDE